MTNVKITARSTDGLHPTLVGPLGIGLLPRLLCPTCGGEQTHLRQVEVGARGEDRPARVLRINTGSGEIRQQEDRPAERCPGRRDWLRLFFDCENGCEFVLSLLQHKGDTVVSVLADETFTHVLPH